MRRIKYIAAAILVLALSYTTYVYFKKQPVESIPERAILVQNIQIFFENEVNIC